MTLGREITNVERAAFDEARDRIIGTAFEVTVRRQEGFMFACWNSMCPDIITTANDASDAITANEYEVFHRRPLQGKAALRAGTGALRDLSKVAEMYTRADQLITDILDADEGLGLVGEVSASFNLNSDAMSLQVRDQPTARGAPETVDRERAALASGN